MTDDDLRARLRGADPAASVPALTPDRAAQLLEQTMTPTPARRFLPVLAAAALVLVAAGLGWALTRPPETVPPAVIAASAPPATGGVVELSGSGGMMAKCAEPSAQRLATETDFVFAGTVTGISGETVTLAVTRVFKGSPASVVRVGQAPGSSETTLGSGRFENGMDYLVASSGGGVLICGYSGEAGNAALRELYEEAF